MSNGRGRLLFRPDQPQFFRIILADSLLQRKLVFPKLFARNYGNNLSNCVILKVPSGKKWKIGIAKAGGEIWMQEGWQEFVEYYSIAVGTFLVFQFDHSDCSFCVSIFDRSTTEIDYPYQVEAPQAKETSARIPVETAPSRKRKETTQVFSAEPPRISGPVYGKTAVKGGTTEDPAQPPRKIKAENVPHKIRKVTDSVKEQEKGSMPDEKPGANRTMTRSQRIKQEQKQPKHPTVQVKMQKSHVNSKSNLNIPASFAQKHVKMKGELLEPSFPHDSRLPVGASKKSNPVFKVVMASGHLQANSSVHVPKPFIGKLDERTHEAKLLVGNRYWPVNLLVHRVPWRGRFSGGWCAFARENCLKVGDVCGFELIDTKSVVVKVTISRINVY